MTEADVNCNGPLARSIDDLGLVLGTVAGPLPEAAAAWRLELDEGPVPERGRLRVATVFHEGGDLVPLSAAVRTSLDDFATGLGDAGVSVDAVSLPVPLADGLRSWEELVLPIIGSTFPDEVYAVFAELESLEGDDLAAVAARSLAGRYRSWARADGLRQRQRAAWAGFFEHYDVVLAPVMPTAAYPHDVEGEITDRSVDVDGTGRAPHADDGLDGGDRIGAAARGDAAGPAHAGEPPGGRAGDRPVPLRSAPAADRRSPRRDGGRRVHPSPGIRLSFTASPGGVPGGG